MIDMEKVLTWLEICGKNNDCSGCCPYKGDYDLCQASLMADAYDLLKEQEAVKIEVKKINGSGRCGRCPNCLIELNEMDYPNYCGFCGQAVKWE